MNTKPTLYLCGTKSSNPGTAAVKSAGPRLIRLSLFFLILLTNCPFSYAQEASVKWGKRVPDYTLPSKNNGHTYDLEINSLSDIAVKPLLAGYHFFISDADGDRCPFIPSCSSFFVQCTHKTDIVTSLLLTADRLSRDANLFNRNRFYKQDKRTHRLLDSTDNYIRHEEKSAN